MIWNFIQERIQKGESVAVLTVVANSGSTPGKPGFMMAIDKDQNMVGTIGGGIMEINLSMQAHERLEQGKFQPYVITQVHHKKAPIEEQSGMICAGTQWIVGHFWDPSFQAPLQDIINGTSKGLRISYNAIEILKNAPPKLKWKAGQSWRCEMPAVTQPTVYVVGSGHVGLALCRALKTLDFKIVAFDHRPELGTVKSNSYADEIVIGPYEQIGDVIANPSQAYVVVVTTGFMSDAESLASILKKEVKFVGLMGSKAKIKHIHEYLRSQGFTERELLKIKAPVGVEIANETPAEIAISIAAELIDVRRRQPSPQHKKEVKSGVLDPTFTKGPSKAES